jgi:hypothetical protein
MSYTCDTRLGTKSWIVSSDSDSPTASATALPIARAVPPPWRKKSVANVPSGREASTLSAMSGAVR